MCLGQILAIETWKGMASRQFEKIPHVVYVKMMRAMSGIPQAMFHRRIKANMIG